MTHYTTSYEGLDATEKHCKAIEDIKGYLGADRFAAITDAARAEPLTLEQFRMAVSFAGVQGYPVKAWYNHCYVLNA